MCLYIDIAMLAMSFLNDLYSSVNVVPFVAAVVGLLFLYWYQRPKNFPPGPRGIPLLGTIPFTGKYVERAAAKWSKHIYGPVMALRLGRDDVIVLNNLDSINKVISKIWDWMCCLANTSHGAPHTNKSLICVPMDTPGVTIAKKIEKIGMHASDTVQVH